MKIADLGYAKMKTSLNSFSVDGNIVGTVAWTSPGIKTKANLTKEQMKEYLNEISIMQSINDPQIVR
jgi:hypothetical protein